jgi:hypothetical protein
MKYITAFLIVFLILPISFRAQTGGPGQPEFMQFQQAGTSDMVNLSSGTFSYQVPLFEIGGYPMNLTYQSGIQMEDVSSMVGLGWNLNAGSIVRTLRGLPDDFKNDTVIRKYSIKPNETYGGKLGVDLEIAGLPIGLSLSADMGIFYNNYKGWGLEPSLKGSLSANFLSNSAIGGSASLGLGIGVNSQQGVDKYFSTSLGIKLGELSISLGKTWSVNSNEGLKKSLNTQLDFSRFSFNYSRTDYLNNSFRPDIDYPFVNTSGTYSGTLGFDGYYIDPNFRLTGYFSTQKLRTKSQEFLAIGSMYESENYTTNELMDFDREKKLPYFIGESKILPIPIRKPDVFNLNAQGLSMTFSVKKNDIGIVGDALATISSNGTQAGIEANLGNLFKIGGNFGTTSSIQTSGRWVPSNLPYLPFKDIQQVSTSNNLYQQVYFKSQSENSKFNHTAFSQLGEYSPVRFDLDNETTIKLSLSNGNQVNNLLINELQPVRQTAINYLTADEASKMGFDKNLKYYSFGNPVQNSILRNDGYRKGHHLSEITVTEPDGMKYVFGIPVYNKLQKDVIFNVGQINNGILNMDKNLVTYTPNQDNSVANVKGVDNFFESTITPAYVSQFLISAVLSPGYSDITNNGISDDDIGNYVKFDYFKDFDYNWRTPFEQNKATYNAGYRSEPLDDKGMYVSGIKEVWYLKSIESKTEIAEYYYSPRDDGYGVLGENGGKNTNMFLRKLDSIKIYSKPDRSVNGNNAIPIKTVHLSYDYSLCKNIENGSSSTTGKLTLKKVAFAYENSQKGQLTPYEFVYGGSPNGIINPDYNDRNKNRWSYFQENPSGAFSDCDNSGLSNIDFPYSLQDKSIMDNNAYAWNLTDLTIPGGGKIKINYEANDYAYIQNKTAGQMFKISGLTNFNTGNSLYDNSTNYNKIYFKLNDHLNTKEELKKKYIQDIEGGYLYYKFLVNLRSFGSTNNTYEYVSGYTKIKDYDLAGSGDYAYVELEEIDIDEDKSGNGTCNPILKTALQFMRINCNKLIYDIVPNAHTDLSSFAQQLPNIMHQLTSQITASTIGVNRYCRNQGYCKTIDLSKSFIRLYTPEKKKISGGSRVKDIRISDNFAFMTGNTHLDKSYITYYDYTTWEKDPSSGDTLIISSGVADYEPLIGGDEISLKQPIFYSDKKKRAPDNEYYVEEPINESLFPSPHITYSKVTQIMNKTDFNVGKTGKIINEFFTAKDDPVKVAMTSVDVKRDKTDFNSFQLPFVAIDQQHDFATVSQGFSIELNNISGLPKATWVYNENGDRVSGEVLEYFTNNNNFTTIDRSGEIHNDIKLGLSAEYTVDGRKSYDKSVTNIVQANFNMSMIGIFPIPIVMPLFSKMTEEKQFQSFIINKVINRNVILKSKTVYDQSSSVITENLAFDEITGEPILTKTTNEFNDTLFSFRYPAYWMYKGMGPSFENTKMQLSSSDPNMSNLYQFLKVGDELRSSTGDRLWVKNMNPVFVDAYDNAVTLNGMYQVYNSGAKNLLSDTAGQLDMWNYNPLLNSSYLNFDHLKILNSSAIEYYDDAVTYCDSCGILVNRMGKNEFLTGRKGNWKAKQSWFYLDERSPGNLSSGLTNIKEQGLFSNYSDFWNVPLNTFPSWTPNYTNWEWKEKVNLTDIDGQKIEIEDRIGRKTANLLGYKNTLVTAEVQNSAYNEAYYEGFEDYRLSFCPDSINYRLKRVNKISGYAPISIVQSHTGKYSLKITSPFTFTTLAPNSCNDSLHSNNDSIPIIWQSKSNQQLQRDSLKKCVDCIGGFLPEKNKKYVFSCWVYVDGPKPVLSCSDASVNITAVGMLPLTLNSAGPMIEGWQRIMGTFITSANYNNVSVTLNKGSSITYFDDLRIFPEDGNMISYVYNDVNLRLTNILDENNYFSKYEYNNQGELIRIKKETEKGIVTMQESNSSLIKHK